MRFLTAMIFASFLFLGADSVEAVQMPIGGPATYLYQPPEPPAPVVDLKIKRRWRVNARMRFSDGSYRLVYITWFGFPGAIDWNTAAVCEFITYRFWSPWERMWAKFEIIGAPVDDMNTPIN